MPNRRTLLKAAAGIAMMPRAVLAETFEPPTLPETALSFIPATGEKIPTVGMGSWLTFDVGGSAHERKVRVAWSTREVVVIDEGLKTGDRVCLTAVDAFVEGMEVIVTGGAGGE